MIENNEIITTDTEGIYMRDYQDTLVPRCFGFNNRTFTMNVYQYAHNPMELYEANQNQPRLNLENYDNTTPGEVALYKGIPMEFRWNPVIREMMMTGNIELGIVVVLSHNMVMLEVNTIHWLNTLIPLRFIQSRC